MINKWENTLWYYPFVSSFNSKSSKLKIPGTLIPIQFSGYNGTYNHSNVLYPITNTSGTILSVLKSNSHVLTFDSFSIQTDCYTICPTVTDIFSNYYSFAALKSDGCVTVWGDPGSGGSIPTDKAPLLTNVKDIVSTVYAYAALKTDGSVITWGENIFGGNSSIANYIKCTSSIVVNYISVQNLINTCVVKVFSNLYSFAALKSDGSVVTWGYSLAGGNSSVIYYSIGSNGKEIIRDEVCVRNLLTDGIVNIFSTKNAYAGLKSNGLVVTWGSYKYGGDSCLVKHKLASGVIYIGSTGSAFAALKSDGSVITWGSTSSGGNSFDVCSNLLSGVISITSTLKAFAALKSDGSVVTWGSSSSGGDSSAVASNLSWGVVGLYSNSYAFAALKSDGSVITWGDLTKGGDSSNVANQISNGIVGVYSSTKAFAALKSDNSVVTWGDFWLGGNSLIDSSKNITWINGTNNFTFVRTKQQIPLKSTIQSIGLGFANINQYDVSYNINGFEYKLINWTNTWVKII
jgi:alpha-tubulin suppressor-like RCC1 family protein